jgi:hypothetical protein
MRAQDLIRAVLDALDREQEPAAVDKPQDQTLQSNDPNRFKQVFDLLSKEKETIMTNKPKEQYATIDAVTTHAGGGMQAPKHPADIRGEHPSMYPAYQAGFGE